MEMKVKKSFRDILRPYLYLSPALISICILTLLPIIYTIYIAFTNCNINNLDNYVFVGLQNFKDILTGPLTEIFFPVLIWTFVFALISTIGCFVIGLILAMVLNNSNMKEAAIYKGILIIPWALPGAIAILAWQGLLNQTSGGINILLMNLHIIKEPIPWLVDPAFAKIGVILANVWLGFPYMMNVCLGALSSIPDTYYEAADIDGANWFQKFAHITLPTIAKTSLPLIITSFAFNFNNFNSAYLITGGNPPRLESQFAGYTDILTSMTYKMAIQFNRYDLGSAMAIIIFIIVATLTLIQIKATGQFKEVD